MIIYLNVVNCKESWKKIKLLRLFKLQDYFSNTSSLIVISFIIFIAVEICFIPWNNKKNKMAEV